MVASVLLELTLSEASVTRAYWNTNLESLKKKYYFYLSVKEFVLKRLMS